MSQVYTFHETVRGHLHVKKEIPCEDYSESFSDGNGRYYIAIVADGHGSKGCFRSNYGSEIATKVTLECLQKFAETTLISEEIEDRFYRDIFSNLRYRQMTIKQLTDTIIAEWHDRVLDDYNNNPPESEEMGESAAEYEDGKNVAHIYGTTLIAALQLPKCLLLLHQGDGRCDVFYTDGSIEQPIPWDSRCEGTTTTSLCDEDVSESFRSCVINLTEKPVIACYLGCDGVEDAYRDTYEELGGSHIIMGGVHTFYKDLTCQLATMTQDEFEEYLKIMLSEFSADGKFSRSGSGDDVSVAGIVDIDAIQRFVTKFQYDVRRYSLEEDLFWKEDELRSKTRKHGILRKRVEEIQLTLEKIQENIENVETKILKLKLQQEQLLQKRDQAKIKLEEHIQAFQKIKADLESSKNIFDWVYTKRFLEESSKECSIKEKHYKELLNQLQDNANDVKELEESKKLSRQQIQELDKKLIEAQVIFKEYDEKYQVIDAERIQIKNKIESLLEENEKQQVILS